MVKTKCKAILSPIGSEEFGLLAVTQKANDIYELEMITW